MRVVYLFLLVLFIPSCNKGEVSLDVPSNGDELYFPPIGSETWETTPIEDLNWNAGAVDDLYDFLSQNGTRGFILLNDGKIVFEQYWGNNIQNNALFDRDSNWYWASAGKTLTAFLAGLAQQEGALNVDNKTSDYLGENWSSLSTEKESLINVIHQLTMTTGLDYGVVNLDCTDPDCLQYKVDAGSQWYYHNAPYTLLENVIENATGQTYNDYTNLQVESKIGMDGDWLPIGDNTVYWSTPRDAARFGLLMLNKGTWSDNQIMMDQNYFEDMITSSQSLNPSYGLCTWLNGQPSIILPGLPNSFNVPLSLDAPSDLFAAMGKNGQYIDVVPSRNIVVIRMGEAPDDSLVPTVFHNDMWKKINAIIN